MSLLTNKKFYLNIGVAILLLFIIILVSLFSLKSCTRHGESITLPDFRGLPLEDLQAFAQEQHLHYRVIDSVYNDSLPKGTVVLQDPYPNSGVKPGRNIYVSIVSSLPESVVMPNVVHLSVRQAVSLIYGNDLTIKNIEFKSGFDKNSVQQQLLDGKEMAPGTKLTKNTAITLVASTGDRSSFNRVPDLHGLTKREAILRIYQNSFNVGNIVGDNEKNNQLLVVSQTPEPLGSATFSLGHKISFRLSPDGKRESNDPNTLTWDSTMIDTDMMIDGGEFLEDYDDSTNSEEPTNDLF